MAFSGRTATQADGGTAISTLACNKPTNTVAGDIMFAWVGYRTTTAGATINSLPDTGWVELGKNETNSDKYYLYYKIAGSSEAATYTWGTSATGRIAISIITFTSGDYSTDANPIDVVSNTGYITSDVNVRAAAMTVTKANSPLVFVGGVYNATTLPTFTKPITPTTGWVENFEHSNATSDYARTVDSYIWTGSSTTGVMNNVANAVQTTKHAFAVALKPYIAPATIITSGVTNILTTTATGKGNITNQGGGPVTDRGVCWNTSSGATISNYHAHASTGGTGIFTVNMTGLTSNTKYYVRAYAYNGGYSYGSNVEFTTSMGFNDYKQDIIDGLVSAQAELHGWNNDVLAAIISSNIVRTSDTVITITLPEVPTYYITADETITVTIPSTVLTGATEIVASPTITIDNIVYPATSLTNCIIDVSNVTAGNRWCSTENPTIFEYCSFLGGGGHAIRITNPGTYNINGLTFTDFGLDNTNYAAIFNDSGGHITLNILDGGNLPSIRNGSGATTTVNIGSVNVTVTAKTVEGNNIQNALVLMLAANGGPMPYNNTVTIINSGTTATVTHNNHGMDTGDKIQITGADIIVNNGVFSIIKINASGYTYTMISSPGTNPIGTIKATYAPLFGLTDVNGEITMSRIFSSDQPVGGRVRKSTEEPLYKTSNIIGTISSTAGLSTTVLLILDE